MSDLQIFFFVILTPWSSSMIRVPKPWGVNSFAPGKFEWNFRYFIFQVISVIDGWGISCELAPRWMSLELTDDKSSQHWFRWWLGAARQQAITWANVYPDLCRHMVLLGPNELKLLWGFHQPVGSIVRQTAPVFRDRATITTPLIANIVINQRLPWLCERWKILQVIVTYSVIWNE